MGQFQTVNRSRQTKTIIRKGKKKLMTIITVLTFPLMTLIPSISHPSLFSPSGVCFIGELAALTVLLDNVWRKLPLKLFTYSLSPWLWFWVRVPECVYTEVTALAMERWRSSWPNTKLDILGPGLTVNTENLEGLTWTKLSASEKSTLHFGIISLCLKGRNMSLHFELVIQELIQTSNVFSCLHQQKAANVPKDCKNLKLRKLRNLHEYHSSLSDRFKHRNVELHRPIFVSSYDYPR